MKYPSGDYNYIANGQFTGSCSEMDFFWFGKKSRDLCVMFYMALSLYLERKLQNIYMRGKCFRQNFRIRLNAIFQFKSNNMQLYTVYIWKLLYIFRVVAPPIIRSAYNCIYNIWYLSHRYRWNSSTIAAGSSNGVTNTICSRYSCMGSWWWVEVPPETCRALSRYE